MQSVKTQKVLGACLVALVILIMLYPFFWVLTGSFQDTLTILRGQTRLFPAKPTIANYVPLFTSEYGIKSFGRYILNSIEIGLSAALLATLVATVSAYALARYNLPGKRMISYALLLIYVFPMTLILMPIEGIFAKLGLIDHKLALVIIHTALAAPFCTWLLRAFFDAVPKELEEAAFVDGAGTWRTFARIVFPMAAPGVLTAFVYSLVASWGEYMFAATLIQSDINKTVPLGLAMYTTEQYIQWGQLLAGTVLTVLPLLLMFLPLAKIFLKGFLEGALKL